ncbi:hypothetical protein [Pontibacter arcticus]|uniref:hypothetical protein n=1 Tax=Pontibacter arcticus TaxID=2080288 RepID=UPI001401F276|nr:hypothetical protein [Pontibacter arcticus]
MTEEEFAHRYVHALDTVLEALAENEEIAPEKFYSVACLIENLRFFSPVLYATLLKK